MHGQTDPTQCACPTFRCHPLEHDGGDALAGLLRNSIGLLQALMQQLFQHREGGPAYAHAELYLRRWIIDDQPNVDPIDVLRNHHEG